MVLIDDVAVVTPDGCGLDPPPILGPVPESDEEKAVRRIVQRDPKQVGREVTTPQPRNSGSRVVPVLSGSGLPLLELAS